MRSKIRKAPNFLFKYYPPGKYTNDAIERRYFWFSYFKNLNDPLEGRIKFSDKFIQTHFSCKTKDEIEKKKEWLYDYHGHALCCFTTNNTNMLMWSHYTNNHSGICAKFNCDADPIFEKAQKVEYSNKPPLIEKSEDYIQSYFRKTTNWSYEREWRLFILLFGILDREKDKDFVNHKLNFKPKCLDSIYFGINTTMETKSLLINISKKNYRKKIKFYNSIINYEEQKITHQLITDTNIM